MKRRDKNMGKKLLLSLSLILLLALSISTALNMNPTSVSAAEYPAVMVESVVNPDLTPGTSFTVSIYTDYEGEDVWGWQFTLSFNADVLHGVEEVTNGELISDTTMFSPGTFDNEAGTLSLTGNFFLFGPGETPPTTNGPGTLAYVTFTVVGYGTSDITLGDETQLKGYNIERGHYKIVDGVTDPYNLGHGYFDNTAPPPEKGTLSGTVTDASTEPIADATVSYVSGPTQFASVTTDDSGAYSIVEELDLGPYEVKASKDGYEDLTKPITIVEGVNTLDFALEPIPVVGLIEGTVTDADTSAAIEEATVTANGYSTTTDASGDYKIEVTPGTYTVTASATGYEVASQPGVAVASGETVTINFALTPIVGGDVAVTNVVPAVTQAYPTWTVPLDISVTVKNVGGETATFTVTAYYDENVIGTSTVTELAPGATMELTFSWDLSAVSWGLYTIKAVATLDGDVNTDNNVRIDGTVKVKMPGDVDGNAKVDLADLSLFAAAWWTVVEDPKYDPCCDFDGNGDVKLADLSIFAANWWTTTDAYQPDP